VEQQDPILSTEQGTPEQLERCVSPNLDAILGKAFPVLDQGFVRVCDYMGNEARIVQAARCSYGKGTKKVSEDRGLIRYLIRHRHSTPLEMPEITFHVRVPMDTWRQWVRHRNSSTNEYSTRYSEAIDAAQITPANDWRRQSTMNRQGSGDNFEQDPEGAFFSVIESQHLKRTRETYEKLLKQGVAREQARKVLSLSTYSEAYWKIDLHNLLHFLALRMDSHAQKEIRDYATVIGEEIIAKWVPNVWEAFNDYHPMRNTLSLTRLEVDVLRGLISDGASTGDLEQRPFTGAICAAANHDWLKIKKDGSGLRRNRERDECEEKLRKLGCAIPWKNIETVKEVLGDY